MVYPSIAFIVPSFEHMGYFRRTLRSFFKYTPWLRFVVVDDASKTWNTDWQDDVSGADITTYRFNSNGGLTRSWNKGFDIAANMKDRPEFTVFANNDTTSNPYWWKALVRTLEGGAALAGPLSNAAGLTAHGRQDICQYFKDYQVTDDPGYVNNLAARLYKEFCEEANHTARSAVNGFFMMGRTDTFVKNAHSPNELFIPNLRVMPSGRKNKTPLMTGQEDELHHRLRKRGLHSEIALGSFVFHYRSVARGPGYAKRGGQWSRCDDLTKEV